MAPNMPKQLKNGPKWCAIFNKMFQIRSVIPTRNEQTKNCQKLPQNNNKLIKQPRNSQNDPKMAKNSPKQSEIFMEMFQMRPTIPTPNSLTKSCEKLPDNNQNRPK